MESEHSKDENKCMQIWKFKIYRAKKSPKKNFERFWQMTRSEKKYAIELILLEKVKRRKGISDNSRENHKM